MTDASWKTLFLSFALISASTICGGALTDKLAGGEARNSFLLFGASIVTGIIILQAALFLNRDRGLICGLLFGTSLGLTIVWFMLCLYLPLFWIDSIKIHIKLLLIASTICLCFCSFVAAFRQFNEKWKVQGESLFAKHYRSNGSTVAWIKVTTAMKLSCRLYIPLIPQNITPILSVMLVFSMIAGLNLRKIFPVFSIFSWGIPASVVVSMFVQLMGLGFAQIAQIAALEKQVGQKIRLR